VVTEADLEEDTAAAIEAFVVDTVVASVGEAVVADTRIESNYVEDRLSLELRVANQHILVLRTGW
jgi:hypothetical protein